eukprot:390849-Rhodomonas_salina.2
MHVAQYRTAHCTLCTRYKRMIYLIPAMYAAACPISAPRTGNECAAVCGVLGPHIAHTPSYDLHAILYYYRTSHRKRIG